MAVKSNNNFLFWVKPDFTQVVKTHKHYGRNYNCALNYAHSELTANALKKEVYKYLKNTKNPLIEKIKDINEHRFSVIGKYMYLLNNKAEIPDEIFVKLLPELENIINEAETKSAAAAAEAIRKNKGNTTVIVPVVSIQDRIKEKARDALDEVDGWVEYRIYNPTENVKTVEDFVNLFKVNELKAPHVRHIQNYFDSNKQNMELAIDGKDKDINEAYSCYTKIELKKFGQFYDNLMKACSMLQEVAKVERAPRKKKPISHDKLVSKLKYKKEDTALGVVSVNPVQIVGAKEVWVYNTKTRKLAQYKTANEQGLTVKGTGLVNFSTDSMEKTLRKPAEALAEFKKASKVKLRTFLKDLSTLDVQASGKLNEHHVILRIDT